MRALFGRLRGAHRVRPGFWFAQKRYGWGAVPATWQGLALVLATMLVAGGICWYSWRKGPERVLWATGAKEIFEAASEGEQRLVNVVEEMAIASLKAFYHHRVSAPTSPEFAGEWSRPGGHPDSRVLVHPSAASPSPRVESASTTRMTRCSVLTGSAAAARCRAARRPPSALSRQSGGAWFASANDWPSPLRERTGASRVTQGRQSRAQRPAGSRTAFRSRATSRIGGAPNSRLYSRLNCEVSP